MNNTIPLPNSKVDRCRNKTEECIRKGLAIASEIGKAAEVLSDIGKVADKYLSGKNEDNSKDK